MYILSITLQVMLLHVVDWYQSQAHAFGAQISSTNSERIASSITRVSAQTLEKRGVVLPVLLLLAEVR